MFAKTFAYDLSKRMTPDEHVSRLRFAKEIAHSYRLTLKTCLDPQENLFGILWHSCNLFCGVCFQSLTSSLSQSLSIQISGQVHVDRNLLIRKIKADQIVLHN